MFKTFRCTGLAARRSVVHSRRTERRRSRISAPFVTPYIHLVHAEEFEGRAERGDRGNTERAPRFGDQRATAPTGALCRLVPAVTGFTDKSPPRARRRTPRRGLHQQPDELQPAPPAVTRSDRASPAHEHQRPRARRYPRRARPHQGPTTGAARFLSTISRLPRPRCAGLRHEGTAWGRRAKLATRSSLPLRQ